MRSNWFKGGLGRLVGWLDGRVKLDYLDLNLELGSFCVCFRNNSWPN